MTLIGLMVNPSNAAQQDYFYLKHKDANNFERHLNPVMLVFIVLNSR